MDAKTTALGALPRLLVGFLLAIGLCVLFMWPRVPVEAAYSRGFSSACNWLIERTRSETVLDGKVLRNKDGKAKTGIFGSTGFAFIESLYPPAPGDPPDPAMPKRPDRPILQDTQISVINFERGAVPGWLSHRMIDSRETGFKPLAMFLALWLAMPMSWGRRGWSLVVGLLLVHAFIALRMTLGLLVMFNGTDPHCLFSLGPNTQGLLQRAFQILCTSPPTSYWIPLLIWMILCLRPETFGFVQSRPAPDVDT